MLGPILEEFKEKRQDLVNETFDVYQAALNEKGIKLKNIPEMKITAQGGVGTSEEHQLLLEEYGLDSVGWGSPFMLVPEACNIEEKSLELLRSGDEDDFYLSDASPLGVHFNNIKGTGQQTEIQRSLEQGKPGFPCTKRFLVFNTEYTDEPICTASKQYLKTKLKEVEASSLSDDAKQKKISTLTQKECLCVGLSNSTYVANGIEPDSKRAGVTICPGPNLAYFKNVVSLKEMVDHIYGKVNLLNGVKRPNLFIKELKMYIEYLEDQLKKVSADQDQKQLGYFRKFKQNLEKGINYYREFFNKHEQKLQEMKEGVFVQLDLFKQKLEHIEV